MTDKTEDKKVSKDLLDTKYGTIDAASIKEGQDKNGTKRLEAILTNPGGKTVTLYVRGTAMDELKAKAAAGEPTFVVGNMFAAGKALNVASFGLKAYDAVVESVKDPNKNKLGEPYQSISIKVAGKDKPWSVLLKGDDVGTQKVGEKLSVDVAWKANPGKDGQGWSSGLVSACDLKRVPAPKPEDAPTP